MVKMKEEMQSWFRDLVMKKGSVCEVPPTEVRNRKIDTHAILSTYNLEEGRNILGVSGVFILFYHTCFHYIDRIYKISKLHMFYNFANAQPIRAIENNETSTSTITPLMTNGFDLAPSPTLTIEVLALVSEVD